MEILRIEQTLHVVVLDEALEEIHRPTRAGDEIALPNEDF